ncbi:acyl-CoA dehydrogenase family protein [Streptomyces sp. NPDC097610]|uniref:acyl-CoA dehydrogenase family protein n=1 Tax=Streptomyces sp. NPDC097610 TaxID=3157227 RepID=UPI00332F1A09
MLRTQSDTELVAEFRKSVAAALDRNDPSGARSALVEAGWLDALATDEAMAVAVVFREQGRIGLDAAALDDVLAAALGTGEVAVAYPAAPGTHMVLPAHRHAERLLWLPDLSGEGLVMVDLDGPVDARPIRGIDPAAGLLGLRSLPSGLTTDIPAAAWPAALAAGRRALSHQLVASSRALLTLATDYARERRQFRTPIADFQAVKHRLAETLVAVETADAAAVAAATTGTVTAAMVAKILAGRAADVAGRNCFQVFGGIAFTSEHDFHRGYRRNLVLNRLLGDRRMLERRLGAQVRTGAFAGERLVDLADIPAVGLDDRGPRRRTSKGSAERRTGRPSR